MKQVELFLNTQSMGTATAEPYVFNVTLPAAGDYALTAVATDDLGTSKISAPVLVNALATPVVSVLISGDGMAVEGGEVGKVIVQRSGDLSAALTVRYKVKGSAVSGVDYKALGGSVTIPAGAAKAKIKIKPIDNATADGTRLAKVKLLPATDNSYVLGAATVAKIKIIDND